MALNIQDYYKKIANENPYALNTDTQAIRQAYDQATAAAHAAEERSIINAENAWQRNLASTQQTALDTIRKNNASAIATGASKGMQAANELSAILGLQDTATEEATALAQQRLDLADKYAAEYAKNAVTAQEMASANKQAMMNAAMQQYGYDTEYAAQELLSRADIEAAKWSNQSTAPLEYITQYENEIAALTAANAQEGVDAKTKAANEARIASLQNRISQIGQTIGAGNTQSDPSVAFKAAIENNVQIVDHPKEKTTDPNVVKGASETNPKPLPIKVSSMQVTPKNYDNLTLKYVKDTAGNKIGEVVKGTKNNIDVDEDELKKYGLSTGKLVQYNGKCYIRGEYGNVWEVKLYG